MKTKDKLTFREMQVIFFQGMAEYPTDADRMEAGLQLLEKFIDKLIDREVGAALTQGATLMQGNNIKGKIIN